MCDYSLEGLPNRLAVTGEQLVTHRFVTGSIGMALPLDIVAANNPQGCDRRGWWSALRCWLNPRAELNRIPAVCIPPGARLRMRSVPENLRKGYDLRCVEDVTFVQLSADAYRYRDAIRFVNGRKETLQALSEGIPFEVLSLDVSEPELQPEALIPVCLD
jgi:hypothetical protein